MLGSILTLLERMARAFCNALCENGVTPIWIITSAGLPVIIVLAELALTMFSILALLALLGGTLRIKRMLKLCRYIRIVSCVKLAVTSRDRYASDVNHWQGMVYLSR